MTRTCRYRFYWLLSIITVTGLLWTNWYRLAFATADSNLTQSDPTQEIQITLTMETRKFHPQTLTLHSGQKVRLVLQNLDTELHAFVPIGLFTDTTLQVSGNGAPEFGPEGFRRVLLPSSGQTEIVFIAQRSGSFPFLCDLPGHDMNGTIVVQDQ